jgi:hypothetical protein
LNPIAAVEDVPGTKEALMRAYVSAFHGLLLAPLLLVHHQLPGLLAVELLHQLGIFLLQNRNLNVLCGDLSILCRDLCILCGDLSILCGDLSAL